MLETYADGVCMMDSLALRRKSPDPPNPFRILVPRAHVELA